MSEHRATITWTADDQPFTYETYSRKHTWAFDNGTEVSASAAPAYLGNADCVDPEEAFVAAVSSCHLLTFLAIAARKRFEVTAYEDAAVGLMEKNAEGKLAVTRIELRPRITFADPTPPPETITQLHHMAHEHCFIANSVKTEIVVVGEG